MQNILPKAALDALAFEEKTLPNGLVVRVLTMPEHDSAHVMFSTRFGSINTAFEQNGKRVNSPAGTAHFLEHKMFENEDGVDAFSLYAATGAQANAYTSFERTCYYFIATTQLDKNMDTLLSTVGKPFFTKETVEKEQGIIGQEIKMYDDIADFRVLFASLATLYHNHPIKDDIAGTVESIAEITPEHLYTCCEAFYHPGNMVLTATGKITMEQVLQAVERAGLPQEKMAPVTRVFPQEPEEIVQKYGELTMEVSLPLFSINFKEKPVQGCTLKAEVVCDMLTELICGETSPLYRHLYDSGLVQPGFSGEYGVFDGGLHFAFAGESQEPEKVKELLFAEIERLRKEGIDEEQFEICKKMMYGSTIADLSSVDRVNTMLTSSYFRGRTPVEELMASASVTLQEVEEALHSMLDFEKSSLFVIWPKE